MTIKSQPVTQPVNPIQSIENISTIDASYVLRLQNQNAELQRQLHSARIAQFETVQSHGHLLTRMSLKAQADPSVKLQNLIDIARLRIALANLMQALETPGADETLGVASSKLQAAQILQTCATPDDATVILNLYNAAKEARTDLEVIFSVFDAKPGPNIVDEIALSALIDAITAAKPLMESIEASK